MYSQSHNKKLNLIMRPIHTIRKIINYVSLKSELESYENIHLEIKKGIIFKGTNLWILFFAIIVASIGLNMNSTAVIIGAMLISPLMGPINGMGYSIATYDSELFRQSAKNFGFAVITSLFASTAYFALSPIATAHSELLSRTSPSIYDVLIALFGGLAGIIAISSKQKGNVIPGVAIATALMPPLCTAGYGLATGQFSFFLGAMYLFTINTVFIALASVAVSQFLNFPIKTLVNVIQKKKVNRLITAVMVIVLLPSIYFGYNLVQKEHFIKNANSYISNISTYEGNYLLKSEVNANLKAISLVYGGMNFSENQKEEIIKKSKNFFLDGANIYVNQGLSFGSFDTKNQEVLKLREEMNSLHIALKSRELQIDSITRMKYLGKSLLTEIRNIYPQILTCTYAESFQFNVTENTQVKTAIILFALDKDLTKSEKGKIESWVKTRLHYENIKVIYE
jgi:uncharacterized hydrophobic protein (TIGR00271 family)